VGSAAVRLAVVRGSRVIGTASPANHDYLRLLGGEPVAYGEGLVERVRALAPNRLDAALDVAGSGVLPDLIELAGVPEHVVTIADFAGAQQHRVRFSSGDTGRAVHALTRIGAELTYGENVDWYRNVIAGEGVVIHRGAAHRVTGVEQCSVSATVPTDTAPPVAHRLPAPPDRQRCERVAASPERENRFPRHSRTDSAVVARGV
jgi:NADPH:quinone reductase-like Zn-dependent oxidoreductase